MTAMFTVVADGSFVFEPIVIWRSKVPRYFKSLKNTARPMSAHYFSNKKTWMSSDIMEIILSRLDCKMKHEKRKVLHVFGKCYMPSRNITERLNKH